MSTFAATLAGWLAAVEGMRAHPNIPRRPMSTFAHKHTRQKRALRLIRIGWVFVLQPPAKQNAYFFCFCGWQYSRRVNLETVAAISLTAHN